ncbi:hypothetical protein RUND412_008862 [Rhizina undulata]
MAEGNNESMRYNLNHDPRALPKVPILRSQREEGQEVGPSTGNTPIRPASENEASLTPDSWSSDNVDHNRATPSPVSDGIISNSATSTSNGSNFQVPPPATSVPHGMYHMHAGPSGAYSGHNYHWMENAASPSRAYSGHNYHWMDNAAGPSRVYSGHNNLWMNNAAGGLNQQSFNNWMGPSSAADQFAQGSMFTRYSTGINQYPWMTNAWMTAPFNGVPSNLATSDLSPRPLHNPLSGAPLGYNQPYIPPQQSVNFGTNNANRPVYQPINPAQYRYPGMVPQSMTYAPSTGRFHQSWMPPPQNAYGMAEYHINAEGFNGAVTPQPMAPAAAPVDELALNNGRITETTDAALYADVKDAADGTEEAADVMDDGPATIAPPVIDVIAARESGLRRYVCSVCGSRFYRPSGLKSHSYTHTGEKRNKKFTTKSNLKRHKESSVHSRIGQDPGQETIE